jgi:hypothetical protein
VEDGAGIGIVAVAGEVRRVGGIGGEDQWLVAQVGYGCRLRTVRNVGRSRTGWGAERQRPTGDVDEDEATVGPVRNIEIARGICRYPKEEGAKTGWTW